MTPKARKQKAALVRQAILAMRKEIKTASSQRRADLFHDMSLALADYDTLTDDELWSDEGEFVGEPLGDLPPVEAPFVEEELDLDIDVPDSPIGEVEAPLPDYMDFDEPEEMGGKPEWMGCGESMGDAPEYCAMATDRAIETMTANQNEPWAFGGPPKDATGEMEDTKGKSGDVPMGAMAEHSNVYANEWDETNRQHISYLLDKVADITAAIEQYEHRVSLEGKKPRSANARKHIASSMKELANAVHAADLTVEETGRVLDKIGIKIVKIHKGMGL